MRSRHNGADEPAVKPTEASEEVKPKTVKEGKRLKKAKAKPADSGSPFTMFDVLSVVLVLGLLVLVYIVCYPLMVSSVHNTCLDTDPLVQKTPKFLSREIFEDLKQDALNHPYISQKVLAQRAFSGTQGFVIRFSEAGISNLTSDPNLSQIAEYFRKIRHPEANAFVMNLLVTKSGFKQEIQLDIDNYKQKMKEYVVGLHLDNSIGIEPVLSFPAMKNIFFLPHQTNVLYLSVPEDMRGGQLVVYEHKDCMRKDKYPTYRSMDCSQTTPDESVRPVENMMVQFRGDAFHGVLSYKSAEGTRVSIVTEQFIIPKKWEHKLTHYEIEMDRDS